MMIQAFLSVLLGGTAILVGFQRSTSRLLRAMVLGVIAFGAFLVWFPGLTDRFAAVFGVGRGADLVMYIWVVITLALIVFLYLRLAALSRRTTQLARSIALSNARGEEHRDEGAGP